MVDLSELTEFRPLGSSKNKKQIILCETKRNAKNYINSLKYRYNGENKNLPNFIISRDGEIYKIMEPLSYANYMNDSVLDKKSIIICMENLGWLERKPLSSIYINWIGDIYKKEAFEKRWRDRVFWQPYDEEKQIESLKKLLKNLCDEFTIPKICPESNVRQEGIDNFSGIISKSSYDFRSRDLNPSFNFKHLKKFLENDK